VPDCRRLLAVLLVVALVDYGVAVAAAFRAPFPTSVPLGTPTAYRNLYIHVPLAWGAYLMFAAAMVTGLLYLARRSEKYDRLTLGLVTVGEAYGVATTVTGMAWAKESWGAAWSWDPRQTGVLLLLLAYLGYYAIRSSIPDPERKRLVSAAYAVAAFSMVPLSFLAAYMFESLHPSFQQARGFMWLGSVSAYFVPRIIGVALVGFLLAQIIAKATARDPTCPRRSLMLAGAGFILLGVIAAGALLTPYLAGDPVRVTGVEITGDGLVAAVNTTGGTLTFDPPIESPVQPPTANGTPTLTGHLVVVEDGGLRVVVHWSVAWSLLVYAASIGGLLVAAGIISRGGAGAR